MTFMDHVLAIFLVVIGPMRSGAVGLRRFRMASRAELPGVRRAAYRTAIVTQWLRVIATGLVWWSMRRPLGDLGLELHAGAGLAGVALGFGVIVVVVARQRRKALRDPEGRAEIRERLDNVRLLLPHTRAEFRAFTWVCLTAGVCEELLYRGYLIWYFSHIMPWWAAALAAAVAFGIGHAYQGARGVAVTTLLGVFLAAVYFVTGSLYASMLIHALMDLHSGDLAWRVYESEGDDAGPAFDAALPGATEEGPHVA
jgi:membrane protease YdiL (CAAX protease family)